MNFTRTALGFSSLLREKGVRAVLSAVADRIYVRWFEWHFGIHSECVVPLKELGIENDLYRPYVPSDYRSFSHMLFGLHVQPRQEVFLDFGSGMGRAVILAATRPFVKVLGVEISPHLNEVARENVRSALPRLRCRNIELITADATEFAIPPEVTIIYFFNPFCGEVLTKVLANIQASLGQKPRRLRIVCKIPAQSRFEDEICQHGWLTQVREFKWPPDTRYLFFEARITETSEKQQVSG